MNSEKSEPSSGPREIEQAATLLVRKIARERGLPDGAADDLQQAVSMKLLSLNEERLRSIENLEAYMVTLVRNEANRLRTKNSRAEVPLNETDHSDQFQFQKRMESSIILQEIWRKLDPAERPLFRMLLFDYNEKEMAAKLNISHAAARKRVSRFRQKLEQLFNNIRA